MYNGLIQSIGLYMQSIQILYVKFFMYDTFNKTQYTPTGHVSWNKIYNLDKDRWKKYTLYLLMSISMSPVGEDTIYNFTLHAE